MQNRPVKGFGLIGKVILFSLLPTYLIVGLVSFFYIRDIKETINQENVEDARSVTSAIQTRIPYRDFFQRPAEATKTMAEMVQVVPGYLKISIYAEQQGMIKVIASTDSSDVGKAADPDDAKPILTGRLNIVEHRPDAPSTVEILAPYLEEGRPVAAIGLYLFTLKRDALVAGIVRRIIWTTLLGSALILIAVYYSVHRVFLLPLRLLATGSDALARGELGYRLPVRGRDEISHLTESFNTMASNLQAVMDQERDKMWRLGILHESSIHFSRAESLEALLDRLVEYSRHLIKSKLATVYLMNQDGKITHFRHSGVDVTSPPVQQQPKSEGLLAAVLKEGTAVLYNDIHQTPESIGLPPYYPPVRSFLAVPVILRDKVIGGIAVANKLNDDGYTQEDEDFSILLSYQAATAIEQLQLFEDTQRLAMTDGLTGLFNHREFQKRLGEELERCKRYNRDFSILLLDIDYFKSFNDTYGHPVGDLVLKEIGSKIREAVRTIDIPARYGGEEFAIIAPETPAENAKILAERLRSNIAAHGFRTPDGHHVSLSVSIGVASSPLDAQDREGLIRAADQSLYFAKEAGRNCVSVYSETLKSAVERNEGKLTEMLSDPSLDAVRDLAKAIDAKTPYTRGHSEEVARYALQLAGALGLDEDKKESLRMASFLHNIGTVSIPDRVLNKPGPFTLEERKIIQAHPVLAEMILQKTSHMQEILPAILYHHERFDGNGYPNGLKGEQIPYLARVLGVVEAYHAMISVRPHRPRMTPEQAMEELRRNTGTQFDAAIVEAFIRSLQNHP